MEKSHKTVCFVDSLPEFLFLALKKDSRVYETDYSRFSFEKIMESA